VSSIQRFPIWRNATTLSLWMPYGAPWKPGQDHVRMFIAKGPEFGASSADYHSFPLDLDDFVTGPSEYGALSDEAYCPCGAVIRWDGGSAGELLRAIYWHCAQAGHPRPEYDR
jgi:hypothetical protein